MSDLCRYCQRRPATGHGLLGWLTGPLSLLGATPAGDRACRDCGAGLLALTLFGYAVLVASLLVLMVIAA